MNIIDLLLEIVSIVEEIVDTVQKEEITLPIP
jgi:hypothetical protein